jgi:hypothetical protein
MRKDFTPKYKYFTNNKDIVVAVCRYAGRPVRGVAKCAESDTFNLEIGKQLAKLRADLKVANMRCKAAHRNRELIHNLFKQIWTKDNDAHAYWVDARDKRDELRKELHNFLATH